MAETETLNLIQKLAKIRAISDVVAKEKEDTTTAMQTLHQFWLRLQQV